MKCKRAPHFIHLMKVCRWVWIETSRCDSEFKNSSLAGVCFLPCHFLYSSYVCACCGLHLFVPDAYLHGHTSGAQRADNRWLPHGPVSPSPRKPLSYQLQKRTVCVSVREDKSALWRLKQPEDHIASFFFFKSSIKKQVKIYIFQGSLSEETAKTQI